MSTTTKWIARSWIALLLFLIPAGSFPHYSLDGFRQEREVENVVRDFHERYNKGQLEEACDTVYWCSFSSHESWNSFVQRVRDRTGAFRKVRSSKIETNVGRRYIGVVFTSSFEKKECEEIFHLSDLDDPYKGGASQGRLKIFHYQVLIDGKAVR